MNPEHLRGKGLVTYEDGRVVRVMDYDIRVIPSSMPGGIADIVGRISVDPILDPVTELVGASLKIRLIDERLWHFVLSDLEGHATTAEGGLESPT